MMPNTMQGMGYQPVMMQDMPVGQPVMMPPPNGMMPPPNGMMPPPNGMMPPPNGMMP